MALPTLGDYPPCWQHRGGAYSSFSSLPSRGESHRQEEAEARVAFLADVLTEGLKPTLADRVSERVVDYLGWSGAYRLRRRKWAVVDCRLLAETVRAVLALKKRTHELVGEAVSRLLPPDTPRFHRTLVKKIAEKVPLPIDAKLEATARGLQVIGIWMCLVQGLPLERCPCLQMLGVQLAKEQVKRHIEDLLDTTARDLAEGRSLRACASRA